jgi:release factor glutamine methyltransferase
VSTEVETTASLVAWGAETLARAGIQPARREARWLLEHACGALRRSARPPADAAERYRHLVERRATRYPLQYVLGTVEFDGLELEITPDVLVPRPETEEMPQLVGRLRSDRDAELKCVDLGTGSGCLAIALARRLAHSRWWAVDRSAAALGVARRNAVSAGVADRITFCRGSWYGALPDGARFDLVVTNPPYVENNAQLGPELAYEPAEALFAGPDGLDAYRVILAGLSGRLKPGGVFIGEIGWEQAPALRALAGDTGLPRPEFYDDLSGRPRFIVIR